MKNSTVVLTKKPLFSSTLYVAILYIVFLFPQLLLGINNDKIQNTGSVAWSIKSFLEVDQDRDVDFVEVLKLDQEGKFNEGHFSSSIGFCDSIYWIKISLANNDTRSQNRVLQLGVSWLDEVDIYQMHDQILQKEWHFGDKRPYQAELYTQLLPEIHLNLPPGETIIYLRAQTVETLLIPIDISTEEQIEEYNFQLAYYFSALYGALLIIALYNLFLYFSIREKSYLFYVLFLFSFIMMNSSYSGFQYQLLFYDTPLLASGLHAFYIYLFQYTGVLFVMVFLNSRRKMPRIHLLLKLFLIGSISTQVICTMFGFEHLLQSSAVVWAGIFGPMLFFIGLYVLIRSATIVTKLFTIGVLSSLIGTTITSFTAYGILPFKFYNFHAVEIGFLIDAVLLSLALAARLKTSVLQRRTELALLASNDGIWDWNILDNSVYFSPRWKDIIGYKDDEIPNVFKTWSSRIHPDDFESTMADVDKSLNGEIGYYENIHRLKHKDGHWVWIYDRGKALQDDSGKVIRMIGTHTDITKRVEAENEVKKQKNILHHQAHHDPLTGLPNRVLFTKRLREGINIAKKQNRKLALFFIDLDKFKEINDSLGHDVGDKVLRVVTDILQKSIRKEDTLARLAGDEFTIIMEDLTDEEAISNVGHKILNMFSEPIQIDDHILYTACSIGISRYPQDADNEKDLLKYADTAMYIAKRSGRNSIQFYNPKMTTYALEQINLKTNLRQAIDQKELLVYYQPQIALSSNQIVGVEALVRWQHPKKGMLIPKKFISLAEETGMITEIDQFVMETAMRQVSRWYEKGLSPGILALNISVKQLENPSFFSNIHNSLDKYNFKPEWLELEITEGHMMQDPLMIINKLKQINSLGISISIDDFGTGYSSLSILKKLPIKKLKIDQSFMRDIPDDEEDIAIIHSIIALAKSLDLNIIAEGIETKEQVNFLINHNCVCVVQGHYYYHPLAAQELHSILVNQK